MKPSSWIALWLSCGAFVGCGADGGAQTASTEQQQASAVEVAHAQQAGKGRSIAIDYAHFGGLIAGVAGGEDVVFVGVPLEGRVAAISRFTGKTLGELPPPPGGFAIPFIMHTIGEGKITVLGAGGLPSPVPFQPANPTLYEYSYELDAHGGFHATRTRDIGFSSVLVGFAENFVHLDDGRYLLTDSILGSIWVVERDGTISPGIVPKTFDRNDAIPLLAFCPTMPEIEVNGYPFLFSGSTLPGVSPITERDGTVYFHSSCARGVYAFPLKILRDGRQPYQRASDIRAVSPADPNRQVEELLDFTFDPFRPHDRWIYAADPLKLRLVRIDAESGRRETVAEGAKLFDFPSSLGFLPPVAGISTLVVVANQQERTPLTNDAVKEDSFNLPFVVAKVFVAR